ncbi:MAG TPA: NAD(P)/FAD-dependent oxidoreductase [Myxococcota bacterium]|nr:NAD(P)/FAD-dependent oxidoreductase [Myxococcota bacterium]
MSGQRPNVIIIGAGLTGSLLAIHLARRGYQVDVFEQRSEVRKAPQDKKRTIAMSLSYRGVKALEEVGLAATLLGRSTPTFGRITHSISGDTHKQFYGREDEAIYTINRKVLNVALIEQAARCDSFRIHYNAELESIDFGQKTATILEDGERRTYAYDCLFGADGVFSKSRREHERLLGIAPQLERLPIGYKEFTIPTDMVSDQGWEDTFVHVWPADDANFVALPSRDQQIFIGNLFCTNEWVEFFGNRPGKQEIIDLLGTRFPQLTGILNRLDEACFLENSANIYMTRSPHWSYENSFLLLGDAIHAMAPFYAMGMNMCLEDCSQFNRLLDQNGDDLADAVTRFQGLRKADVDAMQRISLRNFQTLSESSESGFESEWRMDRLLSETCPEHWITESALISFRDVPISRVEELVKRQHQFVARHQLSYDALLQKAPAEVTALCEEIRTLFPLSQ